MTECVLITGAAVRVGRLMARHVAATGRALVLHYRSSAGPAEELRDELKSTGIACAIVQGDLSDTDSRDSLVTRARAAIGMPLTALVNNASAFDYDTPDKPEPSVMQEALATNLIAPMMLSAAFHAQAEDGANNTIVSMLDQKLWNMNPDFYSYTAGKAGLRAAVTMMDQHFAPKTRACAIAPGLLFPSFDQTEDEFREVASKNLLQEPIDPEEIGRALTYILSARTLRGQVIHVDNGQRFHHTARDIMFSTREAQT